MNQWAFTRPAVADHPAAELLGCLEIKIERLGGNALFYPFPDLLVMPHFRQPGLQAACRYVGPQLEAAGAKYLADSACDKLGMSIRISLGQQRLFPVC
ncbi:MAG: hypothetical protein ABSF29_14680 [Tepidisphaeraceae bacterium]